MEPVMPPLPVLELVAFLVGVWILFELGARAWARSSALPDMPALPRPVFDAHVRKAHADDAAGVTRLAVLFWQDFTRALPHATPANERLLERVGLGLIHHPDAAIFVAELVDTATEERSEIVGMLALLAAPHPMTGEWQAEEIAWYLESEARGSSAHKRLHDEAEAWARSKGCSMIKMVAPHGSPVGSYYARRGYVPVETSWYKAL